MNLIISLIDYLRKKPIHAQESTPKGFCPNCWGKQEYGGHFYQTAKNYNADINSTNPKIGWVQDYANKYLLNIQLQKKDGQLACKKCKLIYQPTTE